MWRVWINVASKSGCGLFSFCNLLLLSLTLPSRSIQQWLSRVHPQILLKAHLNGHRIRLFTDFVDSGIGVCIAVVYTLYFSVVKGTLIVFNCVPNEQGVRVMAAFPSELCDSVRVFRSSCCCRCSCLCRTDLNIAFLCDPDLFHCIRRQPDGVQASLMPYAIASLVLYVVGIPATFGGILLLYRKQIREDQTLYIAKQDRSTDANPNRIIRVRFQELYSEVRPGMSYWRLVLIARKLSMVTIGLMFNRSPLFQARCNLPHYCLTADTTLSHCCLTAVSLLYHCCINSLCTAVLFTSFVMHTDRMPFLEPVQAPMLQTRQRVLRAGKEMLYKFRLSLLEKVYLVTCIFILLSGELGCMFMSPAPWSPCSVGTHDGHR